MELDGRVGDGVRAGDRGGHRVAGVWCAVALRIASGAAVFAVVVFVTIILVVMSTWKDLRRRQRQW